jgi:chromosome segregation ATPase
MSGYEGIHTPNICRLSIKIMSNLSGLLHEHTRLRQRLDESVIAGEMDLNSKLEKSRAELERRIFFEKTADYRERLAELELERSCADELKRELQLSLADAAKAVQEAKAVVYELTLEHSAIDSKLYFLGNSAELSRQNINSLKAELTEHLKKKLYGGNDNGY